MIITFTFTNIIVWLTLKVLSSLLIWFLSVALPWGSVLYEVYMEPSVRVHVCMCERGERVTKYCKNDQQSQYYTCVHVRL